jgi:hypothetical protein
MTIVLLKPTHASPQQIDSYEKVYHDTHPDDYNDSAR